MWYWHLTLIINLQDELTEEKWQQEQYEGEKELYVENIQYVWLLAISATQECSIYHFICGKVGVAGNISPIKMRINGLCCGLEVNIHQIRAKWGNKNPNFKFLNPETPSREGQKAMHGRFKANVPSEACTKLGVSSGTKGMGGRGYTKLNNSHKSTEQGLNFPFCCSRFFNQDPKSSTKMK